jgi:RimJ/RimL family protein N-acetyltransferase
MAPLAIYSSPPLQITVSRPARPAVQPHVPSAQSAAPDDALFLICGTKGNWLGTYCLSERPVQTATGVLTGFYSRYLAIGLPHRGQGYGHLLKKQAVQYIERSRPQPQLFYSYVEASNTRSIQISRTAGFEVLGQLEAFAFDRFY